MQFSLDQGDLTSNKFALPNWQSSLYPPV